MDVFLIWLETGPIKTSSVSLFVAHVINLYGSHLNTFADLLYPSIACDPVIIDELLNDTSISWLTYCVW